MVVKRSSGAKRSPAKRSSGAKRSPTKRSSPAKPAGFKFFAAPTPTGSRTSSIVAIDNPRNAALEFYGRQKRAGSPSKQKIFVFSSRTGDVGGVVDVKKKRGVNLPQASAVKAIRSPVKRRASASPARASRASPAKPRRASASDAGKHTFYVVDRQHFGSERFKKHVDRNSALQAAQKVYKHFNLTKRIKSRELEVYDSPTARNPVAVYRITSGGESPLPHFTRV